MDIQAIVNNYIIIIVAVYTTIVPQVIQKDSSYPNIKLQNHTHFNQDTTPTLIVAVLVASYVNKEKKE